MGRGKKIVKVVVVSGGFDPLHSGHLAYINSARKLGDLLIVALNSDEWLTRKKGQPFMSFSERKEILENLMAVDHVISFDDSDDSCCDALEKIKKMHKEDQILFCNGGDRNKENIPEMSVSDIDFKFGVGGDNKKNSSSWILKNWAGDGEERIWGKFFNLYENDKIKLKELIVDSGKGMSLQRHFNRDEIWFISKGKCEVKYQRQNQKEPSTKKLELHDVFEVSREDWHQIYNPFEEECRIIEIQYGDETSEEDIERIELYKGKNNE